MFPLQAFKHFQTTDCKTYLAKHDSFSTKVKGWGSRVSLIPLLMINLHLCFQKGSVSLSSLPLLTLPDTFFLINAAFYLKC